MERVSCRSCFLRLFAGCLAIALTLGVCGSAAAQSPPGGSFERLVDVGGHRLYVKCAGSGTPTVILESGLGSGLSDWLYVQPEVARFATVCSYDRANLGSSDRVSGPRTSQTTVNELRALLRNAGIAGPYVLVGHSIGGFHVQLFARQDGGTNVTGVVFVDARPLGFHEEEARFGWPVLHSQPNPEGLDVLASDHEVRAAPAFPNLPLVVLTRPIAPGFPAGLEQAWQDRQVEQSRLSPRGELVVAQCAGHYIHVDRPDVVIAAIARVASVTAPPQPGEAGCNTAPPPGPGGSNPAPAPGGDGSSTAPAPGAGAPSTPPATEAASIAPPPPTDAGADISPGPQVAPIGSFAGCRPLTANVIRDSAASSSLVGTARGDRIFAGAGNDIVDGLAGDDCIDLGAGTDRGDGGSGADLIVGGAGGDRLSGSSGNDRLLGAGAADRLVGGPGNDRISGGPGSDTIFARDRGRDRVDCGGGHDTVIADRADRVARNCERIRRR